MNNFEKLHRYTVDITLKHCFDVTLVDFEQIISNDDII